MPMRPAVRRFRVFRRALRELRAQFLHMNMRTRAVHSPRMRQRPGFPEKPRFPVPSLTFSQWAEIVGEIEP